MKMQRKWMGSLALVAALFGAAPAMAGDWSLLDARLEGVTAWNTTGNTQSGILSWVPAYRLSDALAVKGNVGVSAYRAVGNDLNGILNTGVLLGYSVTKVLDIEVGGGVQTRFSASSYGMGTLNLALVPAAPVFGVIQKIVTGYNYVATPNASSELRLGLEINFGTILGSAAPAAQK